MEVIQKDFFNLLSQFYEKQICNHPKKVFLQKQKQRFFQKLNNMSQASSLKLQRAVSPSNQQKSSLIGRSRAHSSQSNKSSVDQNQASKRLKTDEYFKCHWIYESMSFIKSLIYSYLLLTASTANVDLLVYLRDRFLETYSDYFEANESNRIQFYWNKIITISEKKQKFRQKQFSKYFQNFPIEFCSKLFELTVKLNSQNLNLSNLNRDTTKKISQSLGYGLNYYHVSKNFIRTQIKEGEQLIFHLNIVYIQELEKFLVSDRPLQRPSEDESCEKIKNMIGESISELLKKYNKDNLVLSKLQNFSFDQDSVSAGKSRQIKQSSSISRQRDLRYNNMKIEGVQRQRIQKSRQRTPRQRQGVSRQRQENDVRVINKDKRNSQVNKNDRLLKNEMIKQTKYSSQKYL